MPSSGSHSAVVIPVHVLDTPLLPEIFSQFTVALNVVLQAPTPAYSFLKTPVHRGIRFLALFGYGFRAPRAYTTLIKLGLRGTTLGDIVSKTSTVLVSDRASGDHGRAGLRGSFWVVFKGRQLGIYNSWPKGKYQVNNVSENYHKKFSTPYEAVDSFTEYCTSKPKWPIGKCNNRRSLSPTLSQMRRPTRLLTSSHMLWLSPSPSDVPIVQYPEAYTCRRHRKP